MIKSCDECKSKCCKTGPGPYEPVDKKEYLFNARGSKKYNIKCEHFDEETEKCEIWNTKKLPVVCRIYVCSNREYSAEELVQIDNVIKRVDNLGYKSPSA